MTDYKSESLQCLLAEEGRLMAKIMENDLQLKANIELRDDAEKLLDGCREVMKLRLLEHTARLKEEEVSRE